VGLYYLSSLNNTIMSRKARRNYDADFKTKVVLEVLKEQKTLTQLGSEFELHVSQLTEWKKQVMAGIKSLFGVKKVVISEEEQEEITAPLYQEIGRLKVELDFLKKRLRRNL
jgi:transposase